MINSRILVIGGTGNFGIPVSNCLHKAGFDVTVLSRFSNRSNALLHGIKILKADIFKFDEILNALKGIDFIHINLSVAQDEKENDIHLEQEGLNNIINAALKCKIKHISYLASIIQFDEFSNWWVFKIKKNAVNKLKTSGIPYFIFYPSNFIESIYYQYRLFFILAMFGKSKYPLHWIAADDYARQLTNAYLNFSGNSFDFYIQGKEPVNVLTALYRFKKAVHNRKFFILQLPLIILKLPGYMVQRLNYAFNIINSINNYEEKFLAMNSWKLLGKPILSIEDVARKLNKE